MHAATTTFSRYLADADPSCLYFFEPDHGLKNMTDKALALNLASALACGKLHGDWSHFYALPSKGRASHWLAHCTRNSPAADHCSTSWEQCESLGVMECQAHCLASPCVALKSIRLRGRLATSLALWEPLVNVSPLASPSPCDPSL